MTKKQINSTGRSMVEMLGVLAIIGILSIGGLAVYTTAMTKHKANNILYDVSLAFAEVGTQDGASATWTEVDFTPTSGLTTTVSRNADNKDLVKVESISEEVCEKLLEYRQTGDIDDIYAEDGTTELTECTDNQTMVFGYANGDITADDDDNIGDDDDNDDDTTDKCSGVTAINDCSISQDVKDTNNCTTRKAITCGDGEYCSGTACAICPTGVTCIDNECCEEKSNIPAGCSTVYQYKSSGNCTTDAGGKAGTCSNGTCTACSGIANCSVYAAGCATCTTCADDYTLNDTSTVCEEAAQNCISTTSETKCCEKENGKAYCWWQGKDTCLLFGGCCTGTIYTHKAFSKDEFYTACCEAPKVVVNYSGKTVGNVILSACCKSGKTAVCIDFSGEECQQVNCSD